MFVQLVAIELAASERSYQETLALLAQQLRTLDTTYPTLVVLPENFLGYYKQAHEVLACAEAIEQQGIIAKLQDLARLYQVYLVAGSLPLRKDNKLYISSLFLANDGAILGTYRKIHLFRAQVGATMYDESAIYTPGKNVEVVHTSFGKIGMSVCFDLRFASHFLQLKKQQVAIMTVPAAFTAKTGALHWHVLLQSRAIENQAFVIGANLAGTAPCGYETYGHSAIISPNGEILIATDSVQDCQIISYVVDLTQVDEIRRQMPLIEMGQDFE